MVEEIAEVRAILISHVKMVSPRSPRDALQVLDERRGTVRIVAGSTDVSVILKDGNLREEWFLDISHLDALRYIRMGQDHLIHIGALATYGDCIRSSIIRRNAHILIDTFHTLGSPQIRNLATVAGNLGNASPAGDAIPPLFVLKASVVLESLSEKREISVQDFLRGYRKTDRKPNELITEVRLSPVRSDEVAFFKKLGLRQANAIAVASIAFWGQIAEGPRFADARIALGAVAPMVMRARRAETMLTSGLFTEEMIRAVARSCRLEAQPISDIRGSAEYRRMAVDGLAQVGLLEILDSLESRIRVGASKSDR